MKKIFYTVVLFIIISPVLSQDTTKVFECKKYGYTIHIPQSWIIHDFMGDSSSIYATSVNEKLTLSLDPHALNKDGVKMTFDQAYSSYVHSSNENEISDSILAEGKTKLNKLNCRWTKSNWGKNISSAELKEQTMLVYCFDMGNDNMMIVTLSTDVEDYQKHEPFFLALLSTFKKY